MDKQGRRELLGNRLRAYREGKGVSAYRVAREGRIRMDQVKAVENGKTSYTIDTLLGYLAGCEISLSLGVKEDDKLFTITCDF